MNDRRESSFFIASPGTVNERHSLHFFEQKRIESLEDLCACGAETLLEVRAGEPLKLRDWLGGLDSNQDSQSQSLESYQLDDLPAGRNKKESRHVRLSRQPRFNLSNLIGNARSVNRGGPVF
jgi:hypothetical protein